MEQPLKSRIGEIGISKNGEKIVIVAYRKSTDIDVQFEDGTIVKNKRYSFFKEGNIKKNVSKYLGIEKTAKNGQKMKIIKFKNYNDINVEFEDGTIVEHTKTIQFIKGVIANPNYNQYSAKYIGMETIGKNGQKMKIVAYHGFHNIDVKFEDGTIVKHTKMSLFQRGTIGNPKYSYIDKCVSESIGLTRNASIGMKATVIAYRNYQDIDIEFEDGTVVEHTGMGQFKRGSVLHPKFKSNSGLIWSDNYFGYKLKKAMNVNNKIYYEVYKDDQFIAIMTLQEIYKSFQK